MNMPIYEFRCFRYCKEALEVQGAIEATNVCAKTTYELWHYVDFVVFAIIGDAAIKSHLSLSERLMIYLLCVI